MIILYTITILTHYFRILEILLNFFAWAGKIYEHSMKIYQKSTFSSRMKNHSYLGQMGIFADTGGTSTEKPGLDPTLSLRFTEGKAKLLFD